MENKKLSVIIPTYNEEKNIEKCISTLLSQSYKNFEIIVIDDGSTDKTKEIVRRFKKVKLILGEHKGPGFSRNLGAEKAKGDILVFVDADMNFDKDYLKFLIKPIIERKSIGTEEEYQKASNLHNVWSRCWGAYTKDNRFKKGEKGYIFRAIIKSKFFEMKGFDPEYGYADDLSFYFNHNARSDIARGASCYHKNPETLKEVYKQSRWIGASLKNNFLKILIIKNIFPLLLLISSPLAIPYLSFKKCLKNKDISILFPWMLIFMTMRYFGTIEGIFNKIYFNKNVR